MKIFFFTDPHIGIKRSAHTTQASQQRLRDFIYESVMSKMLNVHNSYDDDEARPIVVCVGDLFDTYTNKEDVIEQGALVVANCDYVLAGNHDSRNNVETISSLMMIDNLRTIQQGQTGEPVSSRIIYSENGGKPYSSFFEFEDGVNIIFIPHCFTQEVFEQSIDDALLKTVDNEFNILALHCNVDEIHGASELDSSTLILTAELQKKCKAFDLVLVGHEHTARKKGNIQILGNWFPVAYGELGDRYVYWFDTETKKLTSELLWSNEEIYASVTVEDFLESGGDMFVDQRMFEITGELAAANYPDLSRALAKFWKNNEETLFSVKNSVVILRAGDIRNTARLSAMTLLDRVEAAASKAGYAQELKDLQYQMEQEDAV